MSSKCLTDCFVICRKGCLHVFGCTGIRDNIVSVLGFCFTQAVSVGYSNVKSTRSPGASHSRLRSSDSKRLTFKTIIILCFFMTWCFYSGSGRTTLSNNYGLFWFHVGCEPFEGEIRRKPLCAAAGVAVPSFSFLDCTASVLDR